MKWGNGNRYRHKLESPSMRREWIEMQMTRRWRPTPWSLPPCGGSGLKCMDAQNSTVQFGLPPCGGSGLKCLGTSRQRLIPGSPSMRREWIEIPDFCNFLCWFLRLPPCGGSGLKCDRRIDACVRPGLPPCGGSGLKYAVMPWADIPQFVSLHAEGVD